MFYICLKSNPSNLDNINTAISSKIALTKLFLNYPSFGRSFSYLRCFAVEFNHQCDCLWHFCYINYINTQGTLLMLLLRWLIVLIYSMPTTSLIYDQLRDFLTQPAFLCWNICYDLNYRWKFRTVAYHLTVNNPSGLLACVMDEIASIIINNSSQKF